MGEAQMIWGYSPVLGTWTPLWLDATGKIEAVIASRDKSVATIVNVTPLAAGATTAIGDCTTIDLTTQPYTMALTVEVTYNGAATQGIRVHVRTSYDNTQWDTQDWDTWDPDFSAGDTIRQTKNYDVDPRYVRVLVENLDAAQSVTDLKVIATTG